MVSTSELFKINAKMDIKREGERVYFKTSIQEVTDEYIAIHVPSHQGREMSLEPGDYVNARVFMEDAQYVFNSTVLGRKKDRVLLYKLSIPSNIKRVQMRDYVRIKIQLPVKYKVLEEKGNNEESSDEKGDKFESAYTVDISGGGMQMVVSKPLEVKQRLYLKFKISDLKKRDIEIAAKARVVRREQIFGGKNKWSLGVAFEDISETQRDLIIAFVFRKLIEQRRLEVES
ncbi:MAG: hypothetical protein GX088_01535 [Clostridia bacterium]|nr:hypothetical protein [Clostridia bacterium]